MGGVIRTAPTWEALQWLPIMMDQCFSTPSQLPCTLRMYLRWAARYQRTEPNTVLGGALGALPKANISIAFKSRRVI